MSIYEYMKDFDSIEYGEEIRDEQLKEAIQAYNNTMGFSYDPDKTLLAYKRIQYSKRHEQ